MPRRSGSVKGKVAALRTMHATCLDDAREFLCYGGAVSSPVLQKDPDPVSHSPAKPLCSSRSIGLQGTVQVPGDKSISHRSLMLGAAAVGQTEITGLLESADVHATARAMAAFGAKVERHQDDRWTVSGMGAGGFISPKQPIDFGNAGTGVRLAIGLASTNPIIAEFTGDASLCKRPMGRVTRPLAEFGARFESADGERLPLKLTGAATPIPLRYELPVASAQVKSAILLGALNVPGRTTVIEPVATRDHTERMLQAFGAELDIAESGQGREISLNGPAELVRQSITVPADPSSAAFPIVAALITEGSDVTLPNVMMNPTRTGLLGVLKAMGGEIEIVSSRETGGDTLADLRVRYSRLKGIVVDPDIAPSMIDEYPVLAVAAACADGQTEMRGLEELRVKESDRLAAVVAGLEANGVEVSYGEDWLIVTGAGAKAPEGGGTVKTHMDHRIAMAFLMLGLVSEQPVTVDDGEMIGTSFPDFVGLMNKSGAQIQEPEFSE